VHAAAVSAVAAVRATLGFVFLAPERGDAIAPVTGGNKNFRLVDEFHDQTASSSGFNVTGKSKKPYRQG
jgi:hypothetical protein